VDWSKLKHLDESSPKTYKEVIERCPLLQRDFELREARRLIRKRQAVASDEGLIRWFEHALWYSPKFRHA
jgi:hypothetical protein